MISLPLKIGRRGGGGGSVRRRRGRGEGEGESLEGGVGFKGRPLLSAGAKAARDTPRAGGSDAPGGVRGGGRGLSGCSTRGAFFSFVCSVVAFWPVYIYFI